MRVAVVVEAARGGVMRPLTAEEWGAAICASLPISKALTWDDRSTEARAKTICFQCPLRLPCLEEALAVEGSHKPQERPSIRGGLNGTERWRIYEGRASSAKVAKLRAEMHRARLRHDGPPLTAALDQTRAKYYAALARWANVHLEQVG